MPKEGYESITISKELDRKISDYAQDNEDGINSKTQAIAQAWRFYENFLIGNSDLKTVKIGNKLVGPNQPVFVIAEIGINHNGDLEICKKLIDMAITNGCDAVKFQKRTVDVVYSAEELAKARDSPFGKTNGDLKRGLEFGYEEYKEIDSYCKEKGIQWFASAWDVASVDFLEKFDVPCHKIASACLTDKELLQKIKAAGKPVILSTGMSTMEQISKAVKILGEDNLIIMHCTSTYPTEENEHDLNVIKTLSLKYNCPIGYSGHESGAYPTLVAVALGASVIERHITLDRAMYGSDQAASLGKTGLEIVCNRTKRIPTYLGSHIKRIYSSEEPIIKKLRRVDTL